MTQELDIDYDITVDKMLPITKSVEDFEVITGEFYSMKLNKLVNMQILKDGIFQIFCMMDDLDNPPLFILEVDDGSDVSYYHSNDIEELAIFAKTI